MDAFFFSLSFAWTKSLFISFTQTNEMKKGLFFPCFSSYCVEKKWNEPFN